MSNLIEKFVQMMLRTGIVTGHGDTFEGLLAETEAHVLAQSARIAELERERDELDKSIGYAENDFLKACARAETAEARVERLRGALEPFVKMPIIDAVPDAPNMTWVSVPLGWLRTARSVYVEPPQGDQS